MSDPTETARRVLAGHPSLPAAEELARALLESQAALAAAEEGRLAALDIAKGAYEERDALRSELQAANARADAAEETGDAAERDADRYQSDRDALELRCDGLNADLARVTALDTELRHDVASALEPHHPAGPIPYRLPDRIVWVIDALRAQAETLRRERDEARGQMAVERRQRERCEQEIAESATDRESVRELVDGLREAESVLDVIRQADMLREHAYDDNENGRSTSDDLRATLAAIRPLLAKHAAPAPTAADAKETPAAGPGLVTVRAKIVALRECKCEASSGCMRAQWEAEVLAVVDAAHNAARLAKKGGE